MKALQLAIDKTSQSLNIDPDELQLCLDEYLGVPLYSQIQLLRVASKYQLDPLSDEISLLQSEDGSFKPFITIDGWSKLINNHPQYAGMSLRESTELIDNIPSWMECTIYRNDRILPIIVKEYLEEVRTDHPSWQQMPRRMLRHRVIQQCARLALGISANEGRSRSTKAIPENIILTKDSTSTTPQKKQTAMLKEKLAR